MRDKLLTIKVTEEELKKLHKQAQNCGMKLSMYLRSLGLNYPINSIIDQMTLNELLKAKGDLGRMGGLFKMWLTNNDKKQATATLGSHNYFSIDHLVDDIEKKQEELLDIARRLF
ncbi:DNA transfer system protein TraJ [Sulfurovum sp. enrichment culture clone C5]|uniref:DNA transfer system protein TraJ n=1 Tax=Sulfurovum sp. enrichment culture clone C5 TaxID=497650 RepID=A0A0S4XPF2_9BACT|nr:DNA transfer system protein TraJ [Sulfurovum sp. enrichment culture clone C5]